MTNTQKRAKLAGMMSRMDGRDREQFKRAQASRKPDLDHDLFVVSLHIPVTAGRTGPAPTQYRMTEAVETEDAGQLTLCENEREAVR